MSHETDRVRPVFSYLQGYNPLMKKLASITAFADSDTAVYRLKVIDYYRRFGLTATLAAFPVKRSSLFVWQKTLKESGGRLSSLIPRLSRPRTVRRMQTHPLVLAEICRLRKKHYRLGKKKIYFLVTRYCRTMGIDYPAVSTIGKIVKRNRLFFDKPTVTVLKPSRSNRSGLIGLDLPFFSYFSTPGGDGGITQEDPSASLGMTGVG